MAEKILVIDDHQETINLVSVILKREGYKLFTARSGIEGLTAAQHEDPDLILLDVMMPDMDGLEVCRRLRTKDQFIETPIIMFTAKSMADEKWEGFQAGATDYLIKPTNTEELTRRVRAALNRSSKPLKRVPPGTGDLVKKGTGSFEKKKGNFRPQMVAFVGARGGSGTTTAAINAAFVFSRLYPTLLVDMDMTQGHVAQYLNINFNGGLNDLIAGGTVSMRGQLANETHTYDQQLDLLLTRPNLDGTQVVAEPKQIPHLCDAFARCGRQVIVDSGLGISPTNRPLLERADHIVVCLKPERLAVAGAKALLTRLDDLILPTTTIHVLMLDFESATRIPQQAIEKFLNRKLLDLIQISSQQMAQAVNRGHPLVKHFSDTALPKSFAQVAKALVAE